MPVKKPKPSGKVKDADNPPVKPALEELAFVRKAFQDVTAHYVARVEGDLNAVREAVALLARQAKIPRDRANGLRDVLLILREVEVKPDKGRRRDFKQVESAVKKMRRIVDGWE